MWQVHGNIDIRQAHDRLIRDVNSGHMGLTGYIDINKPMHIARAPGRLDVMGGIADYSGSMVLQLPISEAAVVFCQTIEQRTVQIISVDPDNSNESRTVAIPLSDFVDPVSGEVFAIDVIHRYFSDISEEQQWAAYIAGVIPVLLHESGLQLTQGLFVYVHSSVPEGKGVSSSAAVEVATMRAVMQALGLSIDAHRVAVLSQRVENHVVGAPCGLMDQMTSSLGQADALLALLCQPAVVRPAIHIPKGLKLWGIDSGIRHAVSGADYGSVRVAAFMGYRLLLEHSGIASQDVPCRKINDTRWGGYLANVSVSEFQQSFEAALPETLSGAAFLNRFDSTTDSVTTVDPATDYAVAACTAHPVYEHFRVRLFAALANQYTVSTSPDDVASLMGECMYQSHASYGRCGLGSSGTDQLVHSLRAIGAEHGIYGARITGGGSGGTVAVLADAEACKIVHSVAQEYEQHTGMGGYVFAGSSDGASATTLQPTNNAGSPTFCELN